MITAKPKKGRDIKNFFVLFCATLLILVSATSYAADCNNGGRYEDMGDGSVQDCRTGLIWLKNAYCVDTSNGITSPGVLNWNLAMRWVAGLGDGLCGLTDGSSAGDWRLPTKTELMAMVALAKNMGYLNPVLTNGAGTAHGEFGSITIQ